MRKLMGVWMLALVGATAETGPATKATTKPDMTPRVMEGGVVRKDVAYGTAEKQTLDLYAPPAGTGMPVVVFVHGGEWVKGDKAEVSFKPKYFNEHGVVFVSANYRLSGTDKHPAQVRDVCSAVKWVREHAGEFGGDPAKVFLMGHSAGCHLVTLAGLDPKWFAEVGMRPTDLGGVIAWSGGAYDLVEKVRGGGTYEGYIKANFGEEERAWRGASPVEHVGDGKMPRFLFGSAGTGKADSTAAAERMVQKIRAAGGKARHVVVDGKDHTGMNHEVGMEGDRSGDVLLGFVGR